jgi:hypothetical protein
MLLRQGAELEDLREGEPDTRNADSARIVGDLAARWVGDQITLSDLGPSAPGARDPPALH